MHAFACQNTQQSGIQTTIWIPAWYSDGVLNIQVSCRSDNFRPFKYQITTVLKFLAGLLKLGAIHKCYSSVKCKSNFIELFHKVIKSAPKHKRLYFCKENTYFTKIINIKTSKFTRLACMCFNHEFFGFDANIVDFSEAFDVGLLKFKNCFDVVDLLGFSKYWLLLLKTFWHHC